MSTPLKWKGADPELSIKPGVFKAWSLTVLKQKILDKSVPQMPGEGLAFCVCIVSELCRVDKEQA